eukprot:31205-Chlamydomonas_euryale.AAC.1
MRTVPAPRVLGCPPVMCCATLASRETDAALDQHIDRAAIQKYTARLVQSRQQGRGRVRKWGEVALSQIALFPPHPCGRACHSRDFNCPSHLASHTPHLQPSLSFHVRQVLRLGVYELTQLGSPGHAMGEYVDLVRGVAGPHRPHLAGLVNGVLRSCARARDAGSLPEPEVRRAGHRNP